MSCVAEAVISPQRQGSGNTEFVSTFMLKELKNPHHHFFPLAFYVIEKKQSCIISGSKDASIRLNFPVD